MQTAIQAFRLETSLKENGTLTIDDLPFQAGDNVEVIVLPRSGAEERATSYSLRGLPVQYERPFDSVAEGDWEAASQP